MARRVVEVVERDAVLALRSAVLRPGRPISAAHLPEDVDRPAVHLAASRDGDVVAIGSIYSEPSPLEPDLAAWRLRAMATDPAVRGRGYGAAVLLRSIELARDRGGRLLWCNARTPVVGFYEHHGLVARGDEFDTEVGPHFYMSTPL